MPHTRGLGWLSVAGGVAGVILSLGFAGTDWGEPGTAAYLTYETLNRLTSFALLLMACGWLGATLALPDGFGRAGAAVAFLAAVVMVIGNAAEFWLFTDLPYGDPTNARSLSWMAYMFGDLVQTIGSTMAGVHIRRAGMWSRAGAWALILALPISVAGFMFISPFLGPSILALVTGWNLVRFASGNPIIKHKSVAL
jgi:hypothetical protein